MRPRDLLLTLGLFAVLASAAIALIGDTSAAGELPPMVPGEPIHGAGTAPGQDGTDAIEPAGGAVHPSAVAVTEPVFHAREVPDTSGWTTGVIAGDIPLAPAVLPSIQSISVVIDELKNLSPGSTPPFRKIVRVDLGVGTPTFTVRDVPFSDYGYVVRVHSPGLNGGQATVAITKDHPYVDDLKLSITPGSPFSLLLRDQEQSPVTHTEVRLVPTGEPGGRSRFDGVTDNFGCVVFECVLAGNYQVFIGPVGQPLVDPPVVTVQPGTYLRVGSMVQPQGQTLLVPRGSPVTVTVTDGQGYPVVEARVRMHKTDQARLLELVQMTDVHGKVRHANVLPGQWEVDVAKPDHQRTQRSITVVVDAPPLEVEMSLIRLR